MVEKKSKKAKLREQDLDLYCLEAHSPLATDALGAVLSSLFTAAKPGSAEDEAVLAGLAHKV